jgi:hypothetical protein
MVNMIDVILFLHCLSIHCYSATCALLVKWSVSGVILNYQ